MNEEAAYTKADPSSRFEMSGRLCREALSKARPGGYVGITAGKARWWKREPGSGEWRQNAEGTGDSSVWLELGA